MKYPEVIMHNSISLDGRVTGFAPNMSLHYSIVGSYQADIYMAGSNTARTGIEQAGGAPPEAASDFRKPEKGPGLAYWVIPDSKGSLMGMLHALRGFEFCRDVIVLLSESTSQDYVEYLKERGYDHLICGNTFVDYKTAFHLLGTEYKAGRILVDTGPTLSGILLEQGLVDEISLLVHPCLAGSRFPSVFGNLADGVKMELKLEKQEVLAKNHLHMVWRVTKRPMG